MMEQSLIPQATALSLAAQRTIKRALTLLDRHLRETGVGFTSTQAARDWLKLKMAGLEREEFMVLYLNQQNQLIAYETLFAGSISSTEVHPREVVKRALYFNAAAVILAHNHPSGDTTPSQADKALTQRLVQALQLVDIRVPDHVSIRPPAFFDTAPADTSGTAVSVITPVRSFLTFPACWRYTPNAARTTTDLIPA